MDPQPSYIEVKLNSHGKYQWNIKVNFVNSSYIDAVEITKNIDNKLKDVFPNHVQRASSKVVNFDEE